MRAKFKVSRFIRSRDMKGPKIPSVGHVAFGGALSNFPLFH